jgi:hypothetical protein
VLLVLRPGQEVAGDERVLAGGGLGDAEHQGQVQWVRPAGHCLVQHAIAADALDADAVVLQVEIDVAPADRPVPEGGLLRDQDMPVGGVRPGGAAAVKPGPERPVAEVAEALRVPRDGDAPVRQVQVVQGEIADGCPACGVDGGQGGDQPLPRLGDRLLDGLDLVLGHRQQAGFRDAGLQALGRVGEDQPVLPGEPEQRPDRRDRGVQLVPAEPIQPGPDVLGSDLPQVAAVG